MKKLFWISCAALIALPIINTELSAEGGREGELRGRGGAGGGGAKAPHPGGAAAPHPGGAGAPHPGAAAAPHAQTIRMTPGVPALPRPSAAAGRTVQQMPNIQHGQPNFLNVPQARPNLQIRPSAAQHLPTHAQQQVQTFLSGHRGQAFGRGVGSRQQFQTANRTHLANRSNFANNIRNNIGEQFPHHGNWFRRQFWGNHANPWGGFYGSNWWWTPNWATAANWLDWDGSQPLYYDSGYAYYPSDYYSTDQEALAAEPYPETEELGQEATNAGWLPLGVFAVTNEGNYNATPTIYFQLAIDRNGYIGGTYYNAGTDMTYSLEGQADQETQQVAWKIANNDFSPIFQTGLYNLTQNQTPVRVNFENGSTQDWLMVRLNQQR